MSTPRVLLRYPAINPCEYSLQAAYTSVGDENVVLAWVDDEVGWGIFAAKDFAQGKRLNPPPIGAGTRPHLHCADAGESRICWNGMGWRTALTAAGAFISTIVGVVREQSTIKPTQARSP
jgi:hypothetical protein